MRKATWALVSMLVAAWASSSAVARTWAPAGVDSNWFNSANWNPSDNWPQAGEDVLITNKFVLLTNATAVLGNVTITNAMLVFSNWNSTLSAANVTIQNKGVVTHILCDTNAAIGNTNRVWISCLNLTIETGGKINADYVGYNGKNNAPGQGPGGGYSTYGGGGYGGNGGGAQAGYGFAYGSYMAPEEPGSAGGGGFRTSTESCSGGGAVRIEATGNVVVNGTISVNGTAAYHGRGAGSGGSVYITCLTFGGAGGVVSARGGYQPTLVPGAPGGGGGGGRIAILYDATAQSPVPPDVLIRAAGGMGWSSEGQPGSVYFTDNRFLTNSAGRITVGGVWTTPGLTNLVFDSLIMTNQYLRFTNDGFRLTVTNAMELRNAEDAADHIYYRTLLDLTNGTISCGSLVLNRATLVMNGGASAAPRLECAGNFIITNGFGYTHDGGWYATLPSFLVYAGATNGVNTEGARIHVGETMSLHANAYVFLYSQPTNGGSVRITVSNLMVRANAGFNADANGYVGATSSKGYGPGGGNVGGGGGYGGIGGGAYSTNGQTYGSYTAPTDPGSAGGYQLYSTPAGGNGGGLIWIEATNAVTMDGMLTANGQLMGNYKGAGSGGGIYIRCLTFAGSTSGIVRVNGGDETTQVPGGTGGSGGGGRIAVIYDTTAQNAMPIPGTRFSAAGGLGYGGDGDVGTLYFPDSRFLTQATDGVVTLSGQWMAPGLTALNMDRLTLSNAWLRFLPDGFPITVTNNFAILGTTSGGFGYKVNRLDLTNGVVTCGGNMTLSSAALVLNGGGTAIPTLTCTGNLSLTNDAKLFIYCGMTNGISPNYGALVNVTGDILLAAGTPPNSSYSFGNLITPYSHPTNGGSALFTMKNLLIETNAGFNADEKGFQGLVNGPGYGPGGGLTQPAGGGYGGRGGLTNGTGGAVYGSSNAPAGPGSAGWGVLRNANETGFGGGFVRIVAKGSVEVKGTISANGGPAYWNHGAGSGGGIYIRCRTFGGTAPGVIRANGGLYGTAAQTGGGGGGGRIAVWRTTDTSAGLTVTANGGVSSYSGYNGANGTVVWGQNPLAGALIMIR
jgi:hypothetical protein